LPCPAAVIGVVRSLPHPSWPSCRPIWLVEIPMHCRCQLQAGGFGLVGGIRLPVVAQASSARLEVLPISDHDVAETARFSLLQRAPAISGAQSTHASLAFVR